ncbi:MAG TPA: tRNA 5-hydroxyuridine modification protein YegQ [Cellvibrionaceae bacterium]|nr:tRNA 5-hydroxyuridine modification protein YegQ [Cellvibrionaceae bacterium]HMW47140.1 tRNA 5-hydroxyuridine modification protein YegQ [Cellvibrionaceae bacterium]HMW70586.1 tRNA 5-hydroxyuridine modification protein YegQ [Cellvibrionaceae bacterium]HMY38690.1 tRNA 5-hydroxyuridine modification protein YegQ [Marinagarivorans sp.]HNG59067.1 tRNA 5-hydroxyuridine modification protein YegQ [Cellvibrionaceae bacterium]
MSHTELLSPAGSLKALRLAFAYGADAVYAGQPRFSLRVRNNEFDLDNLASGINTAHDLGKKLYVVTNIAPHNAKLQNFIGDMAPVVDLKPDAMIVSDPGIIALMREHFPHMPLHLSVQANTMNWAAVKFWQSIGIERVILSRELSINEIAEIKQRCPEIELEVFVHGALCMAYSGRCLISSYVNKRDANQGACTNACRWNYQTHSAQESEQDLIPVQTYTPEPKSIFVEQAEHPGELFALEEDEHGSYLFNSKDLRAVEQVEKLIAAGVDSLKIEGRTKSPYYVARTAQVYRRAIDDASAGRAFNPELLSELDGLANRGYTAGFLQRHTPVSLQNYQQGSSRGESQQLVGEVIAQLGPQELQIDVKNRFTQQDQLLLLTPEGNYRFNPEAIINKQGDTIEVAPGSGHIVRLMVPHSVNGEHAMLVKIHGEP